MKKPIQTESALWIKGVLTPVSVLTPRQQESLAVWLKETYLNELCRDSAVFTPTPPEETHKS